MRRCGTDEIFAVAGAGDCASFIVRVSASANDWGIADSSGQLVCRPTGGSRCGQITVLIEGNGTDGPVSILIGNEKTCSRAVRTILFGSLNLLQSVPAFLGKKIFLVHQFHPI